MTTQTPSTRLPDHRAIPAAGAARRPLATTFMITASASVLAAFLPQFALAQALPADCSPSTATDGDTINCVVASPGIIASIATTAADLTVIIGAVGTPTTVFGAASETAISMDGLGSQNLTISAGSEITGYNNGISVMVRVGGTDLEINSAAQSITGSQTGVQAYNLGTGTTVVNVANATGSNNDGITATGENGTDLSVTSTGSIAGLIAGIRATNLGTGATTVTANDVSSTNHYGIGAYNFADGTDVYVTSTGDVFGGDGAGVSTKNRGTGDTTIAVNNVYGVGVSAAGVNGYVASTANDLTITATGTVTGQTAGIRAINYGTGATAVTAVDVSGSSSAGIDVANKISGTDITINSTGDVSSDSAAGVRVFAYGSGTAEINANNVSGNTGIFADAFGSGLAVTATGNVTGTNDAVYAFNHGSGTTSVSVNNATASSQRGIFARGEGDVGDLTVVATGLVNAYQEGIYAMQGGAAKLNVTAKDVSSATRAGIYASLKAAGTDLSVTATGAVHGGSFGIVALNYGSGSTSVTAVDAIGYGDYGVTVRNASTGTDMTITTTGTATGTRAGVLAKNYGSGMTNVNVNNASGRYGVRAISQIGGIAIDATGDVSASDYAIYANNHGSGITSVSANNVTAQNSGIVLRNDSDGTDLTVIATGLVEAVGFGVAATHSGTGAASITVNNVTSSNGGGIYASATGTGLTVTASGTIAAVNIGINAFMSGSGDLNITADDVTSSSGVGINAIVDPNGIGLAVTSTGTITAAGMGAYARNYGTGRTTVSVANVTSTGADQNAVSVYTSTAGLNTDITATGDISATRSGILATGLGSGSLSVTTGGSVSGGRHGILAQSGTSSTDLSVNATGDVTAVNLGIGAINNGTGSTTVVAGNVSAATNNGIYAYNAATGTDMTVTSTGTVTGAFAGVYANNKGTGDTTVSLNNASTNDYNGAFVTNTVAGKNVTVSSTGMLTGPKNGLVANNLGRGALTVAVNDVVGGTESGVIAVNLTTGTDLSLKATGNVTGNAFGISAINMGLGATTLVATDVESTEGEAILVKNSSNGAVSVSTLGTVTGSTNGLEIVNAGTGVTNVSVAKSVTGKTLAGISTDTVTGAYISVAAGTRITGGTVGIATIGAAASDTVTLHQGAVIKGGITLLEGDDTLNIDGGKFDFADGGAGTNAVTFTGTGYDIDGSGLETNSLFGFQTFAFNADGFGLFGDHVGLTQTSFNGGSNGLFGNLESQSISIASGATLSTGNAATVAGDLSNAGDLDIGGDEIAGFSIDGDFAQASTGKLLMNVNGATSDTLVVSGDINLDGMLALNAVASTVGQITLLDGGGKLTGTFASVTGIEPAGILQTQAISYDTSAADVILTTSLVEEEEVVNVPDLTLNASQMSSVLIGLANAEGISAEFRAFVLSLSEISDVGTLTRALQELGPEGELAAVTNAQSVQFQTLMAMFSPATMGLNQTGPTSGLPMFANIGVTPPSAGSYRPRFWTSAQYFSANANRSDAAVGFDADGLDVAAGVSNLGAGLVRFGGMVGYSDVTTTSEGTGGDENHDKTLRLGAFAGMPINENGDGPNMRLDGAVQYIDGSIEVRSNVSIPTAGIFFARDGNTDVSGAGIAAKLALQGFDGNALPVQPFILVSQQSVTQDAMTLGDGLLAIAIDEVETYRTTYGIGASTGFEINANSQLVLTATALDHAGDTGGKASTTFIGAGVDGASFQSSGVSIERQYIIDSALLWELGNGWQATATGSAGFGDLESLGAQLKLAKRF